ncbi:MAG: MerR family transcriptional regulator [Acidobacteria bacterium]|nr:MerR family transcriptional regulator [Acidobacteriota bacterium]
MPLPAEIPNRPLFKASEVCEVAKVQLYVLRSWEQEFPDLGHVRPGAVSRIYRRSDLLRVLRIRQLVFEEGLTLSGARRKMLEEAGELDGDGDLPLPELPVAAEMPRKTRELRARLAQLRTGLRSVLELLDRTTPVAAAQAPVDPAPGARSFRFAHGRSPNGRHIRRKMGSVARKKAAKWRTGRKRRR